MPHQMTLLFANLLLTVVLVVASYLHLGGWQWWFPCLWLVGMALGSVWSMLPRPRAAQPESSRWSPEPYGGAGSGFSAQLSQATPSESPSMASR